MNYYVISPNVWNDGEDHSKEMFEKHIAAVGWGKDDPKGKQFQSIKQGDCIIVAKRSDWKWEYYYMGLVIGDERKPSMGTLSKKLSPIIDLHQYNLNFDAWSANGSKQIPSPQRIDKEKNFNITNIIYKKLKEVIMEEKSITEFKKLLEHTHNLILHGAPGTGKTYLAKQIAEAMGCTDNEIGFVQFHPSYDYTDFLEGLRPVKSKKSNKSENKNEDNENHRSANNENSQIGFDRKDGVFKKFCEKALLNNNHFDNAYNAFLKEIGQKEFELHTPSNDSVFYVSVNSNQNLYFYTGKKNEKRSSLIKDDLKKVYNGETFEHWMGYYQGVLKYLYEKHNLKKNYVFIIDEINRGEISKIFGELFFSIEPGYRGTKGKIKTQYANLQDEANEFDKVLNVGEDNYGHFFIPDNVYIIGTMNDIDRSVDSMDLAMRRRFTFKEVTAKESQSILDSDEAWGKDENNKSLKPNSDTLTKIKNRMDNLNYKIWHEPKENESENEKSIEGLSSAYHIGGAYFLKLKELDNDFDKLWDYHLKGLLREYLRGMENAKNLLTKLRQAYNNEAESEQSANN